MKAMGASKEQQPGEAQGGPYAGEEQDDKVIEEIQFLLPPGRLSPLSQPVQ